MDGEHLNYHHQHCVLGTLAIGESVPLTHADRRRHLYLIGKTGTGKSTLLFNLMMADLDFDRGFALLDPHGDLAQAVADAVPSSRTNDVLYFDPADLSHPVAFNPLERVLDLSSSWSPLRKSRLRGTTPPQPSQDNVSFALIQAIVFLVSCAH